MDKLFGMAGLAILDNRRKGWAGQYMMTDVVVMETMEGFEPCSHVCSFSLGILSSCCSRHDVEGRDQ